jgi:hypothetical protein
VSINLITLDELKGFILEKTNADADTLLTNIITYVSKRFETYLNRSLKKEARTEYFDAGHRIYYLSAFPIDTTTFTVTLDSTVQTIDDNYYLWEDKGKLEFYVKTSYIKPKQLKVDYYGGYAEDSGILDIPDDMKYACLLQCSFLYRRRKDIGLTSINLPDGSANVYTQGLLPEVKDVLNKYKAYN